MPEYLTAEEVVQNKFIFVSYSHANKNVTEKLASFLLSKGVRLWYDKDLAPGDEWKTEVERLLRHSNCRGVIFMCSPESIASKNVALERAAALGEQKQRGKENYYIFTVNISGEDNKPISYMQLLKKVFENQSYGFIDELFPLDRLNDFVEIIGHDPISIMSCDSDFEERTYDGIKRRIPDVIDKSIVAMEKMQEITKTSRIVFTMGQYPFHGQSNPLVWQFLYRNGDKGVFMLKDVLEDRTGDNLTDWINGEFKSKAFSEEELVLLGENVRLLSESEIDESFRSLMANGKQWWLSDVVRGALQKVVREDGTIYSRGYINTRFKKGVRPVIELNLDAARDLMIKQNS